MPAATKHRPATVSSVIDEPGNQRHSGRDQLPQRVRADLVRPSPRRHDADQLRRFVARASRYGACCHVRSMIRGYWERPADTSPAVMASVRGDSAVRASVSSAYDDQRRQQRDHNQMVADAEREDADRRVEKPRPPGVAPPSAGRASRPTTSAAFSV